MKVSLNWVKQYADVPLAIDELVELIGNRLGAVEEVISLGERYQGIIVAKVVTSDKHSDADKLTVCTIDDGGMAKDVPRDSKGFIQIVCGAPNVQVDMLAAWIPPGAIVPSTFEKDPFKVEAREIRGVLSQGMLASPKELGFSDDHEGLLFIDRPAKPGDDFAKLYELDDYIIDIENKMFTHRPDCFGMLGVAREIAGIQGKPFKSPDWYKKDIAPQNSPFQGRYLETGEALKLEIKNEIPQLVPRFCAVALSNITVKPSSVILQSLLSRVGVKPINNIVDLTNYLMLETGQPLHAYDYDKLKVKDQGADSATLVVRTGKDQEKITLLGGKTIEAGKQDIVIATNSAAIGLGGIMGGADTEVDATTKNIVLECANFDMNTIRRTAMEKGLFTDAAVRFTKGQSPLQNLAVLAKMMQFKAFQDHLASPLSDEHAQLAEPQTVDTSVDFINSRLGLELDQDTTTQLLENVEFEVQARGEKLSVKAPFWRTDIEIPEDAVEEVGRLYGYEHLPVVLPVRDLTPAPLNKLISFKSKLRSILSRAGANELLTYSFVHGSLLSAAGQDEKQAYHIRNALSPDLQYYRLSLAPSLLERVHPNIKASYDRLALFEIGKAHVKAVEDSDKLPLELERLALVFANKAKNQGAAYYQARYYLDYLLNMLSIPELSYMPLSEANNIAVEWQITAAAYEPKRSAVVLSKDNIIGLVGEPSSKLRSGLKLPTDCSQLELDISGLEELSATGSNYKPLSRFPSLSQDLCLKTKAELAYAKLNEFIDSQLGQAVKLHGYNYDLEPLDIFQRDDDSANKQTTWRIKLTHPERTLTTEESNKLLDQLAAAAKTELGADRI